MLLSVKISATALAFIYLLMGALTPTNDKETTSEWRLGHLLAFIAFVYWLWD